MNIKPQLIQPITQSLAKKIYANISNGSSLKMGAQMNIKSRYTYLFHWYFKNRKYLHGDET